MNEVLYQVKGSAAWITLNRPQAMNSLTPTLIKELGEALDRAHADEAARVLVVTGAGRAFCAGADLKHIRGSRNAAQLHLKFLNSVTATFRRVEIFPKPVIAAVNGYALAGGLELVLCCDLVLAAKSAKMGDAHANYGLIPGGGSSVRLPRKIGVTRARYLLYTGAFLPSEKLEEWGLVNEVVDDEKLVEAVEHLVEMLADKSPLSLRRVKQLVEDGLAQPVETAVRLETLASEAHMHSRDMAEGLEAFADKRRPVFTGS
jgi:enoyl-CoA hydratase/carnithine racemase